MPVIPSVPYSQIRGALDTGDLFFFYGTSSAAVLIEDLEGAVGWPPYSPWTAPYPPHAGSRAGVLNKKSP
jgi:hypothetical protein